MNKLLEIRKYEQKDENKIINLWKNCNLIVPQNNPKIDIKKKFEFQPELFFVGLIDGKLIGTVMAGYDGHRGWINYLAIHPDYQRKGFGLQLMNFATLELSKLGCIKINLQIRESNEKAIGFYKKIGFIEDHVISFGKRILY